MSCHPLFDEGGHWRVSRQAALGRICLEMEGLASALPEIWNFSGSAGLSPSTVLVHWVAATSVVVVVRKIVQRDLKEQ